MNHSVPPGPHFDGPPASSWQELWLPGEPAVRARWYPGEAAAGLLVWAHGGSWTAGSVIDWHLPCAALARATGHAVLSVEYRLAPRWPYPAPVDDLITALQWAAEQVAAAEHVGGERRPLLVGGDSAGATLAAAAALRARDMGLRVDGQVLAYPPLDPSCEQPSYRRAPRSFPTRNGMLDAWASYRGSAPDTQHYLTPWTAADLSCLAPAVITVGALDPVVDDCRVYADRLREHGTPVTLQVFPDVGHGLFLLRRPDGSFPLQDWIARFLRADRAVPQSL